MNPILKTAVLSLAMGATALAAVPADAADRWHKGPRHYHAQRHGNADMLIAGIAGLAVGAIIAGATRPDYVEPNPYRQPRPAPDRGYYQPAPYAEPATYGQGYAAEPWSEAWFAYCEDRYRSFDPRTGTYMGYDGLRHFCEAN